MQRKTKSMDELNREFTNEHPEANVGPDSTDLRIVLLGVCRAGKSSVGNAILGREAFKESKTRESAIQRGRAEDRNISIIDTPGLFCSHLTDEELQKQMMKSLDLCSPGPHMFLLIINLENYRDGQKNIVQKIRDIFGKEALRFTIVLFTGGEKVSKAECTRILNSEETQKILSKFEKRFHVMNSKDESEPYQITMLCKSIDEMLKNNSGKHFSIEISKKMEEMDKEVKKLIEEIAQERLVPDLRIVLVGKTGSGKSSSGNTILGNFEFKTEMSSNSVTRLCQKHLTKVEGKIISVIDTPGLYDTSVSKEELKKEIDKCVYMSAPGPHVFLLVIRIGRFTEEEKVTVKRIKENFGEKADHYTIILFTYADLLKGKPLKEYISENNDLKALVDQCGGRFHSFNNEDMRNQLQVTELMKKIEKMVEENGGQHYTNEMFKTAQKLIENEAFKQKMKDYGQKALVVVGAGAVGAVAVAGAGAIAAAGESAEAGVVLAQGAAVGARVIAAGAARVLAAARLL